MIMKKHILLFLSAFGLITLSAPAQKTKKPMNIIYILSDDHGYDFMGFTGAVPGLQTPGMDKMAKEGAHIKNAFVTTALCSPSRASILTGQYAHTHTVVDNSAPLPNNLTFYPQYLQKKGYKTAFLGKWHMG
jgi:arylsulfatase A-like enzyme